MGIALHGRRVITTAETEVTSFNVVKILQDALSDHDRNRKEIEYLWNYYCGRQDILNRVKQVRPEITNRIVENRANEIVTFKTSYLIGEPVQYISKGDEGINDAINQLNSFVFSKEKISKDKELADWFHICGTSYRMILPDVKGEEDEAPFEIETLDPRNTFVVYHSGLGRKRLLGVTFYEGTDGRTHYFCYSKTDFYEIVNDKIINSSPHILGDIPIIEYPLNHARIGAFEVVLPLLEAINLTDSNRLDGVEQFIQSLLLLHNVRMETDQIKDLRNLGAIMYTDADTILKGEITYLVSNLNQSETQTLTDHMYETVLTICGMPNRNGGSSTSDTGTAVIMRDGWSAAETRAKDTELIFKKSERIFLKIMLKICNIISGLQLKSSQIDIKFLRGNYENLLQKVEVLTMMLNCQSVHPKLAFETCNLFPDADYAYAVSKKYYEEQQVNSEKQEREADDCSNRTGQEETGKDSVKREASGNKN